LPNSKRPGACLLPRFCGTLGDLSRRAWCVQRQVTVIAKGTKKKVFEFDVP